MADTPAIRGAATPENEAAHARTNTGRSFDPRDAEISLLKRELDQLRARERMARADAEEAQRRLNKLAQASKKFAASMRGGTNERQRYRRRIAAQYAVSRVLARARDLEEAAPEIMQNLGERLGWKTGVLWKLSGDTLRCESLWCSHASSSFEEACRQTSFPRGVGLPGRVWSGGEPVCAENLLEEDDPLREAAEGAGLRGALAFPVRDGGLFGVFEFLRAEELVPDDDLLQTAALIGRQVGQFVERRRAEMERDCSLLREREARRELAGILERVSDAFFALDNEWRFTYVNRKAEQLWGRRREDLLGRNIWEEFPQTVDSESHRQIKRAKEEGVTTEFETAFPALGAWISGRAYPSPDGLTVHFQDVTERKNIEEERNRLRVHESSIRAQAEERRRISRELHDRVAHDIALVHQNLELYEALKTSDPEKAAARMEVARKTTREALDRTRNLSIELRHLEVRRGLASALSNLLRDMVPPNIHTGLSVKGDETPVPPEARDQLFLILREAIRNAVAHSGCGRITVELNVTPEMIEGAVQDDGQGFSVEAARSFDGAGLRSMEERTSLLGGTLDVDSVPGEGTRVEVSVPLEEA